MKKLIKKLVKNNKFYYLLLAVLVFISLIFFLSINYYDTLKYQKKISNLNNIEKVTSVKKNNTIQRDEKKLIIENYIQQKKRKNELLSVNPIKDKNEIPKNLNSKKITNGFNSFVIIIDDAGMNIEKLKRLLSLNLNNLSIAFLPYSDNINYQVKLAKKFGHDIKELNVGGGLGIKYTKSDDPPSIQEW
ncbi:MAG: hypothetical protein CMM18_03745, partial [Rhodospirillaceae bacterium]|nr:hypothetical protein [Rhodospirillaceae bacterium]